MIEFLLSGGIIVLVDHVKLGLDVILFLVCLVIILVIGIFVLKRYWRSNYDEME